MLAKRVTLALGWFVVLAGPAVAGFNPNDLAIVRVGTGSGALTSAATAVFIDEYTTAGQFVQSFALPTSASGGNGAFANSGTATSEGGLNLSTDGHYLALAGYNAPLGTASIASSTVNREVAIVGASGVADTSTQLTTAYAGNNIRSAAVVTNAAGQPTMIYTAGAGATSNGVQLVAFGSTGASTQIASTPGNTRVVSIVNNQLYVVSASSGSSGVNTVGTGIPTSTGQSTTLIAADTATNASPYAFVILGNNLYVADTGLGLLKYTSNGAGGYSLVSELYSGPALSGLSGLTGSLVNGVATLYGTESGTSSSTLLRFTDTGTTINGLALATSASNTAFRGIAFTPTPISTSAVPEPASVVLLGLGLLGATCVACYRR